MVLLSVAFAINYIDRQFLFSAFPRIAEDLSLSGLEMGLAGSLFTWTYAFSMPLSGWVADRVSRPKLIVAALALWSTACLGTVLSRNATELLISRVAMGLTESLYVPAAIGMITDLHTRTRSRALSIHGFAQFIGISLGGYYGGWSAEHIGWRKGYASMTMIGLLYACFLIWQFRNIRLERPGKDSERASSLWVLMRSRQYHIVSFAFFTFCAMLWVLYAWTPTFIHDRFHLDLTNSGITGTLYLQAGAAAGVLLGGWTGDYVSLRRSEGRLETTAFGLIVCSPFCMLIFVTHSLIWLKVAAVLFGIVSGFFVANVFATLHDLVGHESFGLATGLVNMTGGLGAGAAILVAGVMRNHGGIGELMKWTSIVAVLAGSSLLWLARQRALQPHHNSTALM
ncbi:MAG TPA: MFS transporter [Terriglobales bacterium]|nr:MFS transporter [Terriglobales bacterium]